MQSDDETEIRIDYRDLDEAIVRCRRGDLDEALIHLVRAIPELDNLLKLCEADR